MIPREFSTAFVVMRDTPYRTLDQLRKETQAHSGVLHPGRVVWAQGVVPELPPETLVAVYAEGIGRLSLTAGCLKAAR